MLGLLCVLLVTTPAPTSGPVLGIDGRRFTMDGEPTFLLGCSYYAGLGAPVEFIEQDLDDLRAAGFNWLRVWATWDAFDHDVSAVDPAGLPRRPYLARLQRLLTLAGERGMIVDVTLTRGERLPDQAAHRQAVSTLAEHLRPWRNAFFDLANERNIGDARFVSVEELRELAAAVRAIDPERLLTASHAGGETNRASLADYRGVPLDFISPHRPRDAESARRNQVVTETLRRWLDQLEWPVPILYQEPFRRGYGWDPAVEDFLIDLRGALLGGAAGWCLHNGSPRDRDTDRPRRSFDLREAEGRLMDQLDPVEREVVRRAGEVVADAR